MNLHIIDTENPNKINKQDVKFQPQMGLFYEYIRDREGMELLETEHGFAVYKILSENKEVYLRDIFVKKEHRKHGVASIIADKVAELGRQKGCTILSGSVVPTAPGSTDSLKILLSYGMIVHSASNNYIVFTKKINESVG